jgi:hypothetical protein
MLLADWFTQKQLCGFPMECAALGGCDLSVLCVAGEWQWLVRHAGRDVAEGIGPGYLAAKQQAEDAAKQFLHVVARAA